MGRMLNSPESRVIMIKTDAVLAASGKKKSLTRGMKGIWHWLFEQSTALLRFALLL